MVATPARVGLITEEWRRSVHEDAGVQARYGKDARDTGEEPVETFFDSVDDAAIIGAERLKLLKRDRRRFRHAVNQGLDFTGPLDFSQTTPAALVLDTDRGANITGAIVEISLDFGANKTTLVTWGAAENADYLTINADAITIAGLFVEMI